MPTRNDVRSSFRDPGVRRILRYNLNNNLIQIAGVALVVAVLCALGTGVVVAASSAQGSSSQTGRVVAPSCPFLSGPNVSLGYSATLPKTFGSVHAPPFTRLGYGAFHTRGNISFGGYNGVCSAGTIRSINLYLDRHLHRAGFVYSVPPLALRHACGLSGLNFWTRRGSSYESFSWHFHNSVPNGEVWGYFVCDP